MFAVTAGLLISLLHAFFSFHFVTQVPRSVYAAIPGRNKYRPSQETPISNFTLAGDWTSQKFLGSMEGAVLAGKLAAEVIADKAAGQPTK
jgi:15-cis-phytoene desaturase